MVGLNASYQRVGFQSGLKTFLGMALIVVLMALPTTTPACNLSDDLAAGNPSMMIQITGHSFQGNYLIITYDIEYPGMTKVKLFNGNNELLWRNQYVDDKEGEHRLILKASVLNPGNYVFEFDYKNQKQVYSISM